jgi:dihydrofolate reductase
MNANRIIVSNLVTLDGMLSGPDGELDWFRADEEFLEYARGLCRSVGALLFGRRTFQMMEAYWPTPEAIRGDPIIAERMNALPKAVLSRTLDRVQWNNSRILRDASPATMLEFKGAAPGDVAVFGSGQLVSALLALKLIDELRLIVHPTVLGRGRPQFPGLEERIDLQFKGARCLRSGVVMLTYG